MNNSYNYANNNHLSAVPLQGLAPVITHMKSHPHAFFTIFAKIVYVGIQGIEEEMILPVIDLIVERTCQVFQLATDFFEIGGKTQIDRTPQSPTQSPSHLPRAGDRFDQIDNRLIHHESQTRGAQDTVLVFES